MSGSSASAGPRAALDLGSSRARGMISGNDAIIDHPARVRPVADDAHHRGQPETDVSRWCCPVRHGIVIDAAGCTRLTRRLLHTADAAPALREILIGTPVAATPHQRRTAADAVRAAADCPPVQTIEEPLAAAVGCGFHISDPRPRLLMDIGAQLVEAVAICQARVAYAWSLQFSPEPDADADADADADNRLPAYVGDRLAPAVTDIIDCLPAQQRSAARRQGLTLTGGGARNARLAAALTADLRLTVKMAPDPARATIRGLARVCFLPSRSHLMIKTESW